MEKISRSAAKAIGLQRYFTGKPCSKNHVAERYAASGSCIECRKAEYDPEATRKYNAAYRAENAEKLRAYDRGRHSAESAKEQRKALKKKRVAAFVGPPKPPRQKQDPATLKERRARAWADYYQRRKESLAEKSKAYRDRNSELVKSRVRAWSSKNQHRRTALQAKRKARQSQAVPLWYGELDDLVWLEAADLVRLRRLATGVDWAADHMIPCRTAGGLHVWNNCQVITWAMNQSKRNTLTLTEPGEWIRHLP